MLSYSYFHTCANVAHQMEQLFLFVWDAAMFCMHICSNSMSMPSRVVCIFYYGHDFILPLKRINYFALTFTQICIKWESYFIWCFYVCNPRQQRAIKTNSFNPICKVDISNITGKRDEKK